MDFIRIATSTSSSVSDNIKDVHSGIRFSVLVELEFVSAPDFDFLAVGRRVVYGAASPSEGLHRLKVPIGPCLSLPSTLNLCQIAGKRLGVGSVTFCTGRAGASKAFSRFLG